MDFLRFSTFERNRSRRGSGSSHQLEIKVQALIEVDKGALQRAAYQTGVAKRSDARPPEGSRNVREGVAANPIARVDEISHVASPGYTGCGYLVRLSVRFQPGWQPP